MGAGLALKNQVVTPTFYDLHDGGCTVADPALRALTLSQLEKVLAHIRRRCGAERWTGLRFGDATGYQVVPGDPQEAAGGAKVFLTTDCVNLYDTNAHVILPATKSRTCSLMEIMSRGPQKPVWFVSHWWGEPVADFVTCLRQHAKDRGLGFWKGKKSAIEQLDQNDPHFLQQDFVPSQRACYWVCAYANNQHALDGADGAVTKDPKARSFYNAMCLAEGTVSVVDKGGVCFTRMWCCLEVYTSLMDQASQRDYKYDVYTVFENHFGATVALVDGLSVKDSRGGVINGHQYKAFREKFFPTALLERSLEVCLEKGEASVEDDRRHILNSITRSTDLDAEPMLDHPNYIEVNDMLRGRLVSSTSPACLLGTERLRSLFLAALPRSRGVTAIAANFEMDEKLTAEILQAFVKALPQSLTHLQLGEISPDVQPLPYDEVDNLANLQELELYHCRGFTLENFNAGDRTWTECDSATPNSRIMRPITASLEA